MQVSSQRVSVLTVEDNNQNPERVDRKLHVEQKEPITEKVKALRYCILEN
jgi:muramoyltetrapeptide carboxypeptidase LdcA involved in peptidoglycan recycling